MKQNVLEKLEWTFVVNTIAGHCKTAAAIERTLQLRPDLSVDAIQERWRLVDSLLVVVNAGYTPPLSELDDLEPLFRAINVGQLLTGLELRQIYNLLMIVKNVHKFCRDFSQKSVTLRQFHARTYPLPRILAAIESTVDENGDLLDDASAELRRIRGAKLGLRKKIESAIRALFHDGELVKYIQDDFFTVRAERYVVPMKLDGRGRIKGSIYDTSDSGQTLFIEPSSIAPLNEELLELELSEKLEIIRIFRDLGAMLQSELDILKQNYTELVDLDFLTGQAVFAKRINAHPVQLAKQPRLRLIAARHPQLALDESRKVVANDVSLNEGQRTLVISGPNAGGKTVVLKTVGILHVMLKAGLLLPADPDSEVFPFEQVFLELGDAQNISANLSTFSGHLMGIKPIVNSATGEHLVLLDEIAAGTEPHAGSALAQAILESLTVRGCTTIVTTHFDALKALAIANPSYRNASMEYSAQTLQPTYRLNLDMPGQSYGIELAQQIGLPASIIARAQELRGQDANQLESLITELNSIRAQLSAEAEKLRKDTVAVESLKAHWENETAELKKLRSETAKSMRERYDDVYSDMANEFHDAMQEIKEKIKELDKRLASEGYAEDEKLKAAQLRAKDALGKVAGVKSKLAEQQSSAQSSPGLRYEDLREGLKVYINSLQQEGVITKVPANPNQPVEVRLGMLSTNVPLSELRRGLSKKEATRKNKASQSGSTKGMVEVSAEIPYTPQTSTNAVDLRGLEVFPAVEAMWRFIDQAMRAGEPRVVVIHGHGFNKLKPAIREALTYKSPYPISFRPGEDNEGGDGVTIVQIH